MNHTSPRQGQRLGLASWALYDWANSPFTTLIVTFVFPAYFGAAIAGDEARGQSLWGVAMGLSGAVLAVGAPVLGAVADSVGRRKPWVVGFSLLCAAGSLMLWFATPSAEAVVWALAWVVVANIGFEFANVFYNAMLPGIAPPQRLGRLSGWGWALGYFGGLSALALALVGFVQAETPWFGLSKDGAEHVRVIGPLVGVWLLAFGWPLFAFTREGGRASGVPAGDVLASLRRIGRTLRELAGGGAVARFLVAHMLYADGLATVFAFGGIYAAGVFGMTLQEVITFGIVLNVTAGLGAFAFGWVDDGLGSRNTVVAALAGLLVTGAGVLLAEEKTAFWIWGAALGVFVGPAQAASRSLMARLAPPERDAEFFGLMALSGKATAFMGPLLVAWATAASGSQRVGLSMVMIFFGAGLALMLTVPEPRRS